MRVVVAGATGSLGQQLLAVARDEHHWIGLSRRGFRDTPQVAWRRADLLSLRDAEEAVKGADVGVYLIHAASSTARLVQSHQADLDLVAADNFARAAAKAGLKAALSLQSPEHRP